jgi:hypothetical protein
VRRGALLLIAALTILSSPASAGCLLRQSTAKTIRIGPFLDKTDGVTEEVGLAATGTELSKDGGAYAAGPTLGTHDAEGWYPLALTAVHTDTLGELLVKVHDSATHLAVWKTCTVLPANVFDSLQAGTDILQTDLTQVDGAALAVHGAGYLPGDVRQYGGTAGIFAAGRPEVNSTHVSGDASAADNLELFFDGTGYAATTSTVGTCTNLTTASTGSITAASIADGTLDRAAFAVDTGLQTARSGTAQAGAAGSITLDAGASATTDFYVPSIVYLTGGTGAAQGARVATAYNGTTKVLTVVPSWATAPDATTTFALLPVGAATVEAWLRSVPNALVSGRVDASVGSCAADALTATCIAAAAITSSEAPNLDAAVSSRLAPTVAGRTLDVAAGGEAGVDLDNTVGTLAKTIDITGFNDLSAAQVNTEVDTAIVDARLDELLAADSDIDGLAPPTVGSVFHEALTKTAGSFTFDQTMDSLEAIRDRGDAAWTTATSVSCSTVTGDVAGKVLGGGVSVLTGTGARADVREWGGAVPNALLAGRVDANAQAMGTDVIGAAQVAAGAIGASEAPNLDAAVSSRLAPTVSGRTLDVTATGEAGVDWANVGAPSATVDLSGTTVGTLTANADKSGYTLTAAERDNILKAASGTADAGGTTTTIVDAERTEAATDHWKDSVVAMTGGALAGQMRRVSAFAPATDTITVDTAFTAAPAAGDTYLILRSAMQQAGSGSTPAAIADAVWDEAVADHLAAGSTGNKLNSAASAGDPWGTALPGSYASGSAGQIVGSRIPTKTDLIGTGAGTVNAPVAVDGTVTIRRGDTYSIADGTALVFALTGATPSLTGATATWYLNCQGTTTSYSATVTVPATDPREVKVGLTAAQTTALPSGPPTVGCTYSLRATLGSGAVTTLALGTAQVQTVP